MTTPSKRVALVTGATDGLGKGVAHALASAGHVVLVHGRDPARVEAVIRGIAGRGGDARGYRADLSSLDEVRALASAVLEGEPRLDLLVNNAGIGTVVPGGPGRGLSRDGHELRFAVNYLSHYLLTRRLLPLLVRSAPARIVNVSSVGQAPIDFDDVMLERRYDGVQAYCQSKLAQIMFTIDLGAELAKQGVHDVTVTALHPATYMPTKIVAAPISTMEEGIRATMHLATGKDVEGVSGRYFDGLRESRANPQAYEENPRARLRALSDSLCGA